MSPTVPNCLLNLEPNHFRAGDELSFKVTLSKKRMIEWDVKTGFRVKCVFYLLKVLDKEPVLNYRLQVCQRGLEK